MPSIYRKTNQLENQAPGRKIPRALHRLKEYLNYMCNRIESYILLCLLGYDHRTIDNCPLLLIDHLGLRHMNHRGTLIVSFFSFLQTSFREFGEVGFSTYT